MARFDYTASHLGKPVSGSIDAVDEKMAAVLLRRQGIMPISLVPTVTGQYRPAAPLVLQSGKNADAGKLGKTARPSLFAGKKVRSKDITEFTRQLATLLRSGLPLARALDFLSEQSTRPAMKSTVEAIGEKLRGGAGFSECIADYPGMFNALYLSMVRAGESGGILDTTLDRLAGMREAREELTSKVRSAMIYPSFMFLAMIGCVGVLVGFVVPRFATLFQDMGQALPWPTLLLLRCADVVKGGWWLALLIAAAFWFALRQYTSKMEGRLKVDLLKLQAPVLGRFFLTVSMARFCRTVGTLLSSGVPLLTALQAARGVTGNQAVEQALEQVRKEVREGCPVGASMIRANFFTRYVSEMATIGEESGTLDQMLVKVAESYERDIDQLVKSLTSLIEPVMILVMGGLVAFIVMAMLFPIFQMNLMAG